MNVILATEIAGVDSGNFARPSSQVALRNMASPRYPKHIRQSAEQPNSELSSRQNRTKCISRTQSQTESITIPPIIIPMLITTLVGVKYYVGVFQRYGADLLAKELLVTNQGIRTRSSKALSHVWLRSPDGTMLHRGPSTQDFRAHPERESGRNAVERAGIG